MIMETVKTMKNYKWLNFFIRFDTMNTIKHMNLNNSTSTDQTNENGHGTGASSLDVYTSLHFPRYSVIIIIY